MFIHFRIDLEATLQILSVIYIFMDLQDESEEVNKNNVSLSKCVCLQMSVNILKRKNGSLLVFLIPTYTRT